MPHSLRVKIKKLRYKGAITDKDCDRLITALDNMDVLDKIRAEITALDDADYDYEGYYKAVTDAVKIIDKYKAESEEEE